MAHHQGPHEDDDRRRRSEDEPAHVDRDDRHRASTSSTTTPSGWRPTRRPARERRTWSARTGDLTGNRIDLFLKEGANELERLEADGDVTTIETNRTAQGRHLTYTAADETYVMVGTPVEVVAQGDDARARARWPASIRFQRAVDNIQTEGSPVTTTTIPCPGTRD